MYQIFKDLIDRYSKYNLNINMVINDVINGMVCR